MDDTGGSACAVTNPPSDELRQTSRPGSLEVAPFRVLALEGGGLRGIYQASYLITAASRVNSQMPQADPWDLGKCFDLIVGTSTGGLVAAALAANVDLHQVIQLYREHGSSIFPYQALRAISRFRIGDIVRFAGWGANAGDEALSKHLCGAFGKMTLKDVYDNRGIRLAIPTIDMARYAPVVFKTRHLQRLNGRDDHRTLVDVCRATTAAPVLRSMARIVEPGGVNTHATYIDGGLWANNPSVLGMVEASEIVGESEHPTRPINLFTLGTLGPAGGENIGGQSQKRNYFGWSLGTKVLEASLCSQGTADDYLAEKIAELRRDGSFAVRLPTAPHSAKLQALTKHMDDARPASLCAMESRAVSDVDYAWAERTRLPKVGMFFRTIEATSLESLPINSGVDE